MNILFPNIGRRGYLVKYIKEISDFKGKVYVSDCDVTASGLYGNNDGHFILSKPVDDEEKYVSSLLDLCQAMEIKVIIPVIDPEIYILSKYIERFRKSGILLLVSSENVLDICYNKLYMNKFLEENGFPIPKTYDSLERFTDDYEIKNINFPVIIKPIYGSGSEATYVVKTLDEVKALFKNGMIIQEMLDGQEYGVDVFNNIDKIPIRCVLKKKVSMRSGETDKAISVKDKNIQETVIRLAKSLQHFGNLDCDLILKDGIVYIIDLNPRFGGGYPATHEAGVNLLKLVIDIAEGKETVQDFEHYRENILVMKEVAIVSTEVGENEESCNNSGT